MKQKEDVELRGLSVRLYSGTHSLDLLGILQVSILTFRSPGPDGPTRYRYWDVRDVRSIFHKSMLVITFYYPLIKNDENSSHDIYHSYFDRLRMYENPH